jgi:hypothetical protein
MSVLDSVARDISANTRIIGALKTAETENWSGSGDFSVNAFLQSLQAI